MAIDVTLDPEHEMIRTRVPGALACSSWSAAAGLPL
jgi:hypothetical protein